MKSLLKYFLVLLVGICYLCSTNEMFENERKEHFEKESHSFVHAEKVNHTKIFKVVANFDIHTAPKYYLPLNIGHSKSPIFFTSKYYIPPEKERLYIHYASLLI